MQKYKEISGISGKIEFYKFCASLKKEDAKSWDIEDLSTRLNQLYPQGSSHESHAKNLWSAARDNLNRIPDIKLSAPQVFTQNHPLTTMLLNILTGVIISVITIFALEPWRSNTQQSMQEQQLHQQQLSSPNKSQSSEPPKK
jgi:hypothetical protein